MTDLEKELLWLGSFANNKEPMTLIPKELIRLMYDVLKEQQSLLGIQQTADSIAFISTGTAQQGEERGILLGKSLMHEWIYKELLYRGLLTDDIRSVFEHAKGI